MLQAWRSSTQMFSSEYCKFLKNTFLTETLWATASDEGLLVSTHRNMIAYNAPQLSLRSTSWWVLMEGFPQITNCKWLLGFFPFCILLFCLIPLIQRLFCIGFFVTLIRVLDKILTFAAKTNLISSDFCHNFKVILFYHLNLQFNIRFCRRVHSYRKTEIFFWKETKKMHSGIIKTFKKLINLQEIL